jgi:toxin YhaV
LYVWRDLARRWDALRTAVEQRRQRDPHGYVHAPAAKMLKMLAALIFKEIPADPNAKRYRLGHSLGHQFTSWRRAKFFGRFRLFFRFHSQRRAIVYVWLNDAPTLRKAGARTDPCAVFAKRAPRLMTLTTCSVRLILSAHRKALRLEGDVPHRDVRQATPA